MARAKPSPSNPNPLADDPAREQRIRERAYHLWETDGRPHGRDIEYWERARELTGMAESVGSGLLPNPQTAPGRIDQADITEADIQENLGEFPGRLTDRGDIQATPKRRARAKPKKPA